MGRSRFSSQAVRSQARTKKKQFPYLLLLVTILSLWALWDLTTPKLPKLGEPPRLYSNQANLDLRLSMLKAIERAHASIYLVMFGLSDPSILNSISKKLKEKVPVKIYYDPSGTPNLSEVFVGGEIHPIHNGGLMHQKFLVLDDKITFLGSANFTKASLTIHDNLLLGIYSPKLAAFIQEKAPNSSGHLRTMVGGQDLDLWLLPDAKGNALAELKKKIRAANRTLKIALFTFTHPALGEELIRAHQRGVKVTLIVDRYSSIGASAKNMARLKEKGVTVRSGQGGKLLHHKFALIDDQTLIMGSANWTKAAFTKNSDCILFLYNLTSEQKKVMKKIWDRIDGESKDFL